MALAGCSLIKETQQVMSPSAAGEIVIHTGPAGTEMLIWTPAFCETGEVEQFFGFILRGSGSTVALRAVLDPLDGPGLRITGLEGTPPYGVVVRAADCRVLDLRVQANNWWVNQVRDVGGTLDVSCNLGDISLEGSIEVDHCH